MAARSSATPGRQSAGPVGGAGCGPAGPLGRLSPPGHALMASRNCATHITGWSASTVALCRRLTGASHAFIATATNRVSLRVTLADLAAWYPGASGVPRWMEVVWCQWVPVTSRSSNGLLPPRRQGFTHFPPQGLRGVTVVDSSVGKWVKGGRTRKGSRRAGPGSVCDQM